MAVTFAAALTAISAAIGITTQVADVVLKYDRGVYEGQISKVEGYQTRFGNHLTKLNGLKSNLREAWQDQNTENYIKQIDTEIKAVNNANDQATKTIQMLRSILSEIGGRLSVSDDVSSIKGILDQLSIQD